MSNGLGPLGRAGQTGQGQRAGRPRVLPRGGGGCGTLGFP
jgi:hypothetical protein